MASTYLGSRRARAAMALLAVGVGLSATASAQPAPVVPVTAASASAPASASASAPAAASAPAPASASASASVPTFAIAPAVPIPATPVGFSKLLVRLTGRDEIGIASADFHIHLIERMREKGFQAVGAENLLFNRDETSRAEFFVGGTVHELTCNYTWTGTNCRIGVEWQVLDVARDTVVYAVTTRFAAFNVALSDKESTARTLVDGAFDRLLVRDGFHRALTTKGGGADAPAFPAATIHRCAVGRRLAESAEDLLQDVVVVKDKVGHGSGVIVSPEGLILTAAHVVTGDPFKIRLRDGTEVDGVPVRVSPREDVALLRTVPALTGHRCAVLRTDSAMSGSEVFAAGAPASLDLAFSLTRGIVSGYPVIDSRRRLQTDASVNPGNSGGPISDADGSVLGVVSFKVVANKIEGLAFAVPVPETLAALALKVGDVTDASLLTTTARPSPPEKNPLVHDADDVQPSIDPGGEAHYAEQQRAAAEQAARDQALAAERRRQAAIDADVTKRTPSFVKPLRYSGLALGLVGFVMIPATYVQYSSRSTTESQFDTLRTWNTVGWVGLGLGAGVFITSFLFRPAPRPDLFKATANAWHPRVDSVGFGPSGVSVGGSF